MQKVAQNAHKRSALGMGLDALLPPKDEVRSIGDFEKDIVSLPIDSLSPNANQPRRLFREESLEDLRDSIREIGVIQPIIARPAASGKFEIVAGERRWRAAKMAACSTVPVIVRELSDAEAFEIALIENLQRENLNPLDTAEAYDTLITKFSYTHDALARRIGKDRTNITNHIRLLRLPDPIKDELRNERLSMGHARTLLAVENVEKQLDLSGLVVRKRLSVRELEKIVQNFKKKLSKSQKTQAKQSEVVDLERNLSSHLSAKVSIRVTSNGSGKLEVHFHSMEELDRLFGMMGYKEDFA